MAWAIGAQDVSNALGTSVGAKAVTVQQAIYIAGICEFLGSLAGGEVAGMISGGILSVDKFTELGQEGVELYAIVMLSTMSGAFLWLAIATYFSLPVSTTHSLVGALVGVGTVTLGTQAVNFTSISAIVASWVTSPLLGGAISYIVFSVIHTQILMANNPVQAVKRVLPHFYGFTIGTSTVFMTRVGPRAIRLPIGSSMIAFIVTYCVTTFFASQPKFVDHLASLYKGKKIQKGSSSDCGSVSSGRKVNAGVTDTTNRVDKISKGDRAKVDEEVVKKSSSVRKDVDDRSVAASDLGMDPHSVHGRDSENRSTEFSPRSDDVEAGGGAENQNHSADDSKSTDMPNTTELSFGPLMVITACVVSIAHGSNDVSNAVGPFTAIVHIYSTQQIPNGGAAPVWVLICGGVGIVAGLGTYGHKVMATIGEKIAKLTFTRGFAAQIGTALTVLCATQVRIVFSSVHLSS